MAVTIDPKQGERYQGIVPLESDSIEGCINHYFESSEQLDTKLWLSSEEKSVGGLLIQRVPEEGGRALLEDSNWQTLATLADTITKKELSSEAGPLLIYKLFHELNPEALILGKSILAAHALASGLLVPFVHLAKKRSSNCFWSDRH